MFRKVHSQVGTRTADSKSPGQNTRGILSHPVRAYGAVCAFFSHPDYTVGFGISPNRPPARFADCTAGGDMLPAPKNFYVCIGHYNAFRVAAQEISQLSRADPPDTAKLGGIRKPAADGDRADQRTGYPRQTTASCDTPRAAGDGQNAAGNTGLRTATRRDRRRQTRQTATSCGRPRQITTNRCELREEPTTTDRLSATNHSKLRHAAGDERRADRSRQHRTADHDKPRQGRQTRQTAVNRSKPPPAALQHDKRAA